MRREDDEKCSLGLMRSRLRRLVGMDRELHAGYYMRFGRLGLVLQMVAMSIAISWVGMVAFYLAYNMSHGDVPHPEVARIWLGFVAPVSFGLFLMLAMIAGRRLYLPEPAEADRP